MITLNINSNSPTPIYIQIYEYIAKEIINGNFQIGMQLPSKRSLSSHLGISLNTVITAYNILADEGYIESKERVGYFIKDINLLAKKSHEKPKYEKISKNKNNTFYDFSYNNIDAEIFPFTNFKKLCRKTFDKEMKNLLSINDRRGLTSLRKAIAKYLKFNRGFNISHENIIISGGTEYLFKILFSILPKNSSFAIENPGYEKWPKLFEQENIKYRTINVTKNGMSFSQLVKTNCNVVCITPSHQFPTGVVMPVNKRAKFLNWANEKENRFIVEDDYDSEYKYTGKPIPSMKSLDFNNKVIYIGNFSKSISPSLRISYMVLPDLLLKTYMSKEHIICPVSLFIQNIVADFITEGYYEKHLNRSRNFYNKKRELLIKAINKYMPNTNLKGTNAGFHFILKTKLPLKKELEFVEKANNENIKLNHITKYWETKEKNNTGILIGFGKIEKEKINTGIEKLSKIYKSLL